MIKNRSAVLEALKNAAVNEAHLDDGQRVSAAIKKIDGKRLQYRESVENPPYLPKLTGQMEAPF